MALHVLLREIGERLGMECLVLIRRRILANGDFVQRFACALPRVGEAEYVVTPQREAPGPAVHAILHRPRLLAARGDTQRESPDGAIAVFRFLIGQRPQRSNERIGQKHRRHVDLARLNPRENQ